MLRKFLVVVVLCTSQVIIGFKQSGYNITFERAEVISYNPDYLDLPVVKFFKYNRTCTAFNASYHVKKDLNNNRMAIKVQIKAYKFISNEYRDFPILFSYGICEAVRKNDFGLQRIFACGVAPVCPILKKGNYSTCNFVPDERNFPPYIPDGSYMVDIKGFYGNIEIVFGRGYASAKTKYSWDL